MKKNAFLISMFLLTAVGIGSAYQKFSGMSIINSQVNSSPVGNVTPSTGVFTNATATGNFFGNLIGNVTGNVTGNLNGNATTATTAANLANTSQCTLPQVASGINTNGTAVCVNLTHGVAATFQGTSCAMVHYGDTDQNCTGTGTWSNSISGSYETTCNIGVGAPGGNDSSGLTQTSFSLVPGSFTSTTFQYNVANIHDGAGGQSVQLYCTAIK